MQSTDIRHGMQVLVPSKELAQKHYAEHDGKPFFPKLVDFLSSGAVVATVWEGKEVVKFGRTMIGATNPLASPPGTIRLVCTLQPLHNRPCCCNQQAPNNRCQDAVLLCNRNTLGSNVTSSLLSVCLCMRFGGLSNDEGKHPINAGVNSGLPLSCVSFQQPFRGQSYVSCAVLLLQGGLWG